MVWRIWCAAVKNQDTSSTSSSSQLKKNHGDTLKCAGVENQDRSSTSSSSQLRKHHGDTPWCAGWPDSRYIISLFLYILMLVGVSDTGWKCEQHCSKIVLCIYLPIEKPYIVLHQIYVLTPKKWPGLIYFWQAIWKMFESQPEDALVWLYWMIPNELGWSSMTKVIQNYDGDVKAALCRSNVRMPSFATNIFALIGHLCKRGEKLVGHNYNVTQF